MAVRIVEFFGFTPLSPQSIEYASQLLCPFVHKTCIKPRHGACSLQAPKGEPVICCPNRLYGENFKVLLEIAQSIFGSDSQLLTPQQVQSQVEAGTLSSNSVAVFGRYSSQELPLPKPQAVGAVKSGNYYMDWILAKLDTQGNLLEFTAVEVQTIDTTGSYLEQAQAYFKGEQFLDKRGALDGYSNSGFNWENVNKRILPQLIYKGHALRREMLCSKGLFFVCPKQVLAKIRERLGNNLQTYHPGNGTITFRSYELLEAKGVERGIKFVEQFTTTVDQVALAFTSPMNLPNTDVYKDAIIAGLKGKQTKQQAALPFGMLDE